MDILFTILEFVFLSIAGLCMLANIALIVLLILKKRPREIVLNILGILCSIISIALIALGYSGMIAFIIAWIGFAFALVGVALTLISFFRFKNGGPNKQ